MAALYHDFHAPARVATIPSVAAHIASAGPLPAGGFGSFAAPAVAFHGVRARSRQERRHSVNRDATEKERLRDRREKFDVYAEPGQVVAPDAKDSALFMSSGDRFFTDMGAEQRHEREEALHKRQAETARRRDENAAREELRWAKMEEETRAFQERTLALQRDGRPAIKNQSGQPFNPLTQDYAAGDGGARLREQDAFLLFKAAQRAEYLTARGAGSSFNPLTGLAMEKRDFAVQGPGGMTVGIGGVVSGGVNGGGVSLPPRGGGGGGGGGRR